MLFACYLSCPIRPRCSAIMVRTLFEKSYVEVRGCFFRRFHGVWATVVLCAEFVCTAAQRIALHMLHFSVDSPHVISSTLFRYFYALGIQELVDRTRAHPRFQSAYDFSTDATWITAPRCWDGCSGLPQVVAMDCEMCMSEVGHSSGQRVY